MAYLIKKMESALKYMKKPFQKISGPSWFRNMFSKNKKDTESPTVPRVIVEHLTTSEIVQEETATCSNDTILPLLRQIVSVGDPTRKYVMIRKIDKGAFGTVYKAIDKTTGQKVAIKVATVSQTREDMFVKEIMALKMNCEHSNIIKYYDSYLLDDKLWIVMELIEGESVHVLTEEELLYEGHIAAICRDVLQSLEHLHENCFIHRDIKPSNILVGLDGAVKLIDFGISAQVDPKLKRRNSLCGTVYYLASEMVSGDDYGPKVDIWALGVSALHMSNRVPPYPECEELDAILDKIYHHEKPILDGDYHSEEFLDFLDACIEIDETKRPTATQLLTHPFIETAISREEMSKMVKRASRYDS